MIMGADPIAAARALGDAIYYVHGKDARIERGLCDVTVFWIIVMWKMWQNGPGIMWR